MHPTITQNESVLPVNHKKFSILEELLKARQIVASAMHYRGEIQNI